MSYKILFPIFLGSLLFSSIDSLHKNADQYHIKLQQFFHKGVTGIIWSEGRFNSTNLSKDCKSSMILTMEHLHLGSKWAHQLIDSSSKINAGILRGNVGSFGDYDQCLAITQRNHEPNFIGSHSLVQLDYKKRKDVKSDISLLMSETFPVLGVVNLHFALCLPSTCSGEDIKSLVSTALKGYPFKVPEKAGYPIAKKYQISTETKNENFFSSKINQFSRLQFIGLAFILCTLSLCWLAVISPFLTSLVGCEQNQTIKKVIDLLSSFHPIENTKDLFKIENHGRFTPSNLWVDWAKISMIFAAVIAHSVLTAEHFIPLVMMYRLNDLKYFWKDWIMQPINEIGFCGLAVMCAYYHFNSFYDLMKEGKLNVGQVILKKYLRFIIPIAGLISFELVSPIFGSGPIYGAVSREVVGHCEKSWWRQFAGLGNHEVDNTCVGYMFMTSVTIQLLLIGLVLINLLARIPKLGAIICTLIFSTSVYKLYQDAKKLSSPLAFTSPFSITELAEFFKVCHFPLTPHLIGYTSSLLLIFALKNGFRLYNPTRRNSRIHLVVQVVVSGLTVFLPGLHNCLKLVPPPMYPAFILLLRFGYMSTMFQMLIFSYHWPKEGLTGTSLKNSDENNNRMVEKKGSQSNILHSITKALHSIAFSMAVINYPFTRWNQVSSRTPVFFTDLYSLSCRILYSIHFVLILGFLFQIFFVSPFEKLMKQFLGNNSLPRRIKSE